MKKKLIVLAAAAMPCLAVAEEGTVTIYGMLEVLLESVEAPGATNPAQSISSRSRVSPSISNIGFRGIEPLGGGTSAFFQVESNAQPDTGGGTWASRNSGVGLTGNWGTALLGQWDTPLKVSTARIDPFGINIGDAASMFRNGGQVGGNTITGTGNARASFHRRQQNLVQYWLPDLSGFSGRIAYGANEEKVSGGANPSLWSGSVTYDKGPLFLTGGYERHKDYGGAGLTDKGYSLGAAYKFFGTTTLGAGYSKLKYEFAGGLRSELSNWLVSLTHVTGPHIFRGYYQRARDPKGDGPAIGGAGPAQGNPLHTAAGGGKQFVVGYGYTLSKRTELFGIYSRITNDPLASYDFGTNQIVGASAAPQGSDPRGFGVGIKHIF
jgi:predicted porin